MENLFHRKSSERALYHLCVPVRGCYCRNSCWLLLQALLLPSALGTRIYHPSTLSLSKQHAFWFLCMVKHTMFIASLCQKNFWLVHLLFSLIWFTMGLYFLELIKNQISSSSEAGHLQRLASSVELLSLIHKKIWLLNLYHEDFFPWRFLAKIR